MDKEKELFEQFIHHNMPQEPFDPDKILTGVHEAAPDYQPSEEFLKNMDRLFRKSKRQARIGGVKKFFSIKGVPQIAVSLSMVICALFIAQANNGAIFDLLFQTHQTHTGVQLADQVRSQMLTGQLKDLDIQIYFPRYLPDGYVISDVETSAKRISFNLTNGDNFIFIVQKPLNGYKGKIALDSEDVILEKVAVNEYTGFYKVKGGVHTLHFFDNNNFYKILGTALSKKELIRIAESFEMVV